MKKVHPTAIVSKKAKIDPTVQIGPYAIIEDDVKIDRDVKIYAHSYICSGTEIGEGTEVHMGTVIGHVPQDLAFKGGKTFVKIGKKNVIREGVTIHRGTKENTSTVIGDENFLMVNSHVGHNCVLGNKNILANGALLGGYVTLEDQVFISGNVSVHQFCRIGRLAMMSGLSATSKDIPPYMTARGASKIRYINVVGLRRAGFTNATIREIREAFKIIYRSNLTIEQAAEKILELKPGKEAAHLAEFIKNSKRGIARCAKTVEEKLQAD